MHFDSDILLHQRAGHSWLADAMTVMRRDPSAMFVAPRPGPPTIDGGLRGQYVAPTYDEAGNFRFKQFSSRRFLVSKRRFDAVLPTPLLYTSRRDRVLMGLGFGNAVQMWEECVARICGDRVTTVYTSPARTRGAYTARTTAHDGWPPYRQSSREWKQASSPRRRRDTMISDSQNGCERSLQNSRGVSLHDDVTNQHKSTNMRIAMSPEPARTVPILS